MPALLAGLIALGLFYAHYRRRRTLAALLLLGLFALLFPHINYATEARGYAYAGAGVVAAWFVLTHPPRGQLAGFALYSACTTLAMAAHLTTLHVLPALALYQIARPGRPADAGDLCRRALTAMLYQLPAMATLVFIYLIDIRHTIIGAPAAYRDSILHGDNFLQWLLLDEGPVMLNEAFGLGWTGYPGLLSALLVVGLVGMAAWVMLRRGRPLAALYPPALLLVPLALLVIRREVSLFPRFMLVNYVLLLGTFASLAVAGLTDSRRWLRHATIGLLVIVLASNAWRLCRFYQDGRGNYRAAIRHMAAHIDAPAPVLVAGDHDFRQSMILGFYARHLEGRLRHVPMADTSRQLPHWFIVTQPQGDRIAFGPTAYVLDSVYPAYGYSGQRWHLFRRHDILPVAER